MMMMRMMAMMVALLLAPAAMAAGPKAGETFGFLSGHWAGDAWVRMGDRTMRFRQTERVAPHLDGSILLVEGKATGQDAAAATLFSAFAVLSWNPDSESYEFRSYSGGRSGTFRAELAGPATLRWVIEGPKGTTRYTHRIEGDRWIGTGEFSADGTTWTPTLGMELVRVGDADFGPGR